MYNFCTGIPKIVLSEQSTVNQLKTRLPWDQHLCLEDGCSVDSVLTFIQGSM
jgi:hypothetical protein